MKYEIKRPTMTVELTEYEARTIFETYREECMREDVYALLNDRIEFTPDELREYGYTTEELLNSDETIDAIVRLYLDSKDNSEEWWYQATGAIRAWLEDNRKIEN